MGKLKKSDRDNLDLRCFETRVSRLISGVVIDSVSQEDEAYFSRVSPIRSLRNIPNDQGVRFQYGKRKGQLKPWKHKDCNDIV